MSLQSKPLLLKMYGRTEHSPVINKLGQSCAQLSGMAVVRIVCDCIGGRITQIQSRKIFSIFHPHIFCSYAVFLLCKNEAVIIIKSLFNRFAECEGFRSWSRHRE